MNKIIPFVIIIIFILGGIYYLESTKINIEFSDENIGIVQEELKDGIYPKAPELTGISGYLNTEDGLTISGLKEQGKVVLIDFWTYTCINCIRTLPYLTSWDEKYRDKGLVIIGVHTPEFAFEKKYENVEDAIKKYNIKYPVVQDNDYLTWRAFENRYWPRKYLIDTEGYIRYDHIGEGAYGETEEIIKELLSEIGKDVSNIKSSDIEESKLRLVITPELYAGYNFALSRGQNIGNDIGLQPDTTIFYSLPNEILDDIIYLEGEWKSNADDLLATKTDSLIVLKFLGESVNIVADNLVDTVIVEITVDGKYLSKEQAGTDVEFEEEKSFIVVDTPQLYNIIEGAYGRYELKLEITEKDFSFNAFTFG